MRQLRFFGLTLLLSLPCYGLGMVLPGSRLPMQIPYSAVMIICPMLAALILWAAEGHRPRLRFGIAACPLVLSAIVGILIALFAAGYLSGGGQMATVRTIAFSIPLFFIAAIPEEIGWSAYATDAGLRDCDSLKVGALIGLGWAMWHWWPWAVLQSRPLSWIAGMTAINVVVRMAMAVIWAERGRSLGTAALIHAALNTGFLLTPGEGAGLNTLAAAVFLVAPLVLTIAATRARG